MVGFCACELCMECTCRITSPELVLPEGKCLALTMQEHLSRVSLKLYLVLHNVLRVTSGVLRKSY